MTPLFRQCKIGDTDLVIEKFSDSYIPYQDAEHAKHLVHSPSMSLAYSQERLSDAYNKGADIIWPK